jgi:hypothetical protein
MTKHTQVWSLRLRGLHECILYGGVHLGNSNDESIEDDDSTGTVLLTCTFFLSISVSSQCAGSEVKPLTEDRGCDRVLLGQSNRTPHGAVIDEYGAMVE